MSVFCPPCTQSDAEDAITNISADCESIGNWLDEQFDAGRVQGYDYATRPEAYYGTLGALDGTHSAPEVWYEKNNHSSLQELIDTFRHEYGHYHLEVIDEEPIHLESEADHFMSYCPDEANL